MKELLKFLFAPGFFQSTQVIHALILGSIVAATSGVIGVFAIIRGQTFATHAIADFGGAGAAIAFLAGINTLWGFLGFGVLAASGVELLGNRAKERDLATGVVLSIALGVQALFLYLDTHFTGKASAPMLILFGSIFIVNSSTIHIVILLTIATAIVMCIFYRPLLLCSIDPELAKTRGVQVRLISIIFIILLAFVVEEGALITGSLLSAALLIGPAAAAMRITHKMSIAMLWSSIIGVVTVWLGVILAYDSFYWPPVGRGWSVSFFVSVLVLLFYILARIKEQFFKARNVETERVITND
jgi:zinc/manganese transport system permease protein